MRILCLCTDDSVCKNDLLRMLGALVSVWGADSGGEVALNTQERIFPAWSLLDQFALERLLGSAPAISVVDDAQAGIAEAPLIALIRLLIARAIAEKGLCLTATGNLSRADVGALFAELDWPGFDKETVLALNKVLNEHDVFPVHIARIVAREGKLLRKHKGRFFATNRAKVLIGQGQEAALFRVVFETLLWQINLAYFDHVAIEDWPQDHIGIVLWSLSVSAQNWMASGALMPICTLPCTSQPLNRWHTPEHAFEARVLRQLTWLGLMEARRSIADHPFSVQEYRKTPAFDQMLRFDVSVSARFGSAH